jgi:hypothetical protein
VRWLRWFIILSEVGVSNFNLNQAMINTKSFFCIMSTVIMFVLLNLSCSKSNVDPNLPDYFIATVDGTEINFDNDIKAQINIPKQVSLSNPYTFLIEANKFSVAGGNLMYLFVHSQLPIKVTTYDNSIRPDDVWFTGAGGTSPTDRTIPTGSKVIISSLTDTQAEGTFYGEIYPQGDISSKKIIIKDGRFRVHYKVSK